MTHFVERADCPGCGSSRLERVYEAAYSAEPVVAHLDRYYGRRVEHSYLNGAHFVLDLCKDCELIYQREIPDPALMGILYERWVNSSTALARHRADTRIFLRGGETAQLMNLIRYLGKVPGEMTVLDYGMGWGNWCHIAAAFNCEVYGFDLSESKTANGMSGGFKMIDWNDIPQHRFDYIHCEQVFEHLADPYATLNHLKKALVPGGLVEISVPNGGYLKEAIRDWDWSVERFADSVAARKETLMPIAPLQHVNAFTKTSILAMGRRAGLVAVDIPQQIRVREYRTPTRVEALKAAIKTLIPDAIGGARDAAIQGNLRVYLQSGGDAIA